MTHLENTQSLREALAVAEAKLAAAESKVLEINDAYTTLDANYASEQTHAAALEAKLAAAEQSNAQLRAALKANLKANLEDCGECADEAHELARAALAAPALGAITKGDEK